jgi:putative FmdB family regulatory protein
MPIYEFDCLTHGRFEMFLKITDSVLEHYPCIRCGEPAERAISAAVVKPDSLWSGVMTPHGYVTSQSQLNQVRKEKGFVPLGDRSDVEAMKKTAEQARRDWDTKLAADTQKHLDEHLIGSGILNADGNLESPIEFSGTIPRIKGVTEET